MTDQQPCRGVNPDHPSSSAAAGTVIASAAELTLMFAADIPCDVSILAADREVGADHGAARWRLTLTPCLATAHEQVRAVICNACASWLGRHMREYAEHEGGRIGSCPGCGADVDVLNDYTLEQL